MYNNIDERWHACGCFIFLDAIFNEEIVYSKSKSTVSPLAKTKRKGKEPTVGTSYINVVIWGNFLMFVYVTEG